MFKFGMAAVAVVILFNVSILMRLSFEKPAAKGTVIDPSGYYNLTHPEEKQPEEDKSDKGSAFMADFFGLPAIILCLAVWMAVKRERTISLPKAFIFFLLSWLIFEGVAYTLMIFGTMTIGFGSVVAPFLAAISMFLFLKIAANAMGIQISGGTKAIASGLTAVLSVLPVLYFFQTSDTNNFAVLLIIIWQLVAVWALSRQWVLKPADHEEPMHHLVSEVRN
jgi:hypothetical protein